MKAELYKLVLSVDNDGEEEGYVGLSIETRSGFALKEVVRHDPRIQVVVDVLERAAETALDAIPVGGPSKNIGNEQADIAEVQRRFNAEPAEAT